MKTTTMKSSIVATFVLGVILILGDNNNNNNSNVGVSVVSASNKEWIPKKNWAEIGYESFFGKRPEKVGGGKIVPSKKPQPPSTPPPSSKAVAPKKTKTKKKSTVDESPNAATKAFVGVAVAVTAAAIGGKALSIGDQFPKPAEWALVESLKKPIVARNVPMPKPVPAATNIDGATIPNEVFNLVKAIVGVGVLSLPAGVAAFGSAPSAFIPAGILIATIGVLSGYGFALIGKVCAYTGAQSYRDAWSRTVGEGTSWIPAWSTTLKTFLACLAFSMVLADTFSSLFETSRNETLFIVTLLILLPLCLMKNLKSLAPFSLVGVMGMAYTAFAMTLRWLDGSYTIAPDGTEGRLVSQLAANLKPKFGDLGVSSVLSPNALILVCMLSTAYMAHFNAPKFYLELKNNTIKRFHSVVGWSFGISILLMGFITMVGFLSFGKACDGLVLNNYAGTDVWMGLSRIAVAISLVFSYPLAFTGFRDGFLDIANVPMQKRSAGLSNFVTVALLGVITGFASSLTDVSFVLAFGGATLGNLLTYVYPALMYQAVVKQQGRRNEQLGVNVALGSAILGIAMGLIGATMALRSLG